MFIILALLKMNKLVIILLSILILLQSMQLKPVDFLSMGDLWEHAQMHLDDGKSLTDFYDMHFGKEAAQHLPQDQEHKNLPFHHQFDFNQTFLCLCIHNVKFDMINLFISSKKNLFHYINNYFFIVKIKIVQPPIF